MDNPLGVLSGTEQLQIKLDQQDILLLSAGVFVAMLAALLIAKQL